MHTHSDAIAALQRAGIPASRRKWALGDTVVVPLGHPSEEHGITVYPSVAWLVPTEGSWRLEQPVALLSRKLFFSDLEAACRSVIEIARAFAVHRPCDRCGHSAQLAFGERCGRGVLQSWVALRCPGCGAQIESDDVGPLPDGLRELELVRHGTWIVRVERPTTAPQWAALRKGLELSVQGLAELKGSLPGPVFSGTFAEAERLRAALAENGVLVERAQGG